MGIMNYSKVEISGINTSELKTLSEKEKTQLLIKSGQGDKSAREKLIKGNLRLVLSVLQKFSGRSENADDLFQVGVIGLIKAVDNFDVTQCVRFSTYAVPMISGEIRRYLRDYQPVRVSRSMRDLAYKAMQAREKLLSENQREPTAGEIADKIGAKRSDVVIALESVTDPVSIYEPVCSDSGETLYVIDRLGDYDDSDSRLDELAVKEAIANLLPKEKKILDLRYFKGLTQVETAESIGISQAQVSRLEKNALERIKSQL